MLPTMNLVLERFPRSVRHPPSAYHLVKDMRPGANDTTATVRTADDLRRSHRTPTPEAAGAESGPPTAPPQPQAKNGFPF